MGFKRIGSLLARDVSETTFGCTTAYYIVIRGGTHKTDTREDDVAAPSDHSDAVQ